MNHPTPPKWADRFLEWYCRPDLLEEIQGDVYELFDRRAQKQGLKTARRRFIWDVIRSFRLSTIKKTNLKTSPIMFKSHLKIAIRSLYKQKIYTCIKIFGFALAIACCLFIGLFVRNELSYDRHFTDANRIYRVGLDINLNQSKTKGTAVPAPLASTLLEEFPEVEIAARLNPFFFEAGTNLLRPVEAESNLFEEKFVYADQTFLDMFDVAFVEGDPGTALLDPLTVVITEQIAQKYFPNQSPIGETFILNDNLDRPYKITGVLKDLPSNTHFDFNFFMSMEGLQASNSQDWISNNFYAYVKLKPGTYPETLEAKARQLSEKYMGEQFLDALSIDFSSFDQSGDYYQFFLQPITAIHLHSDGIRPQLAVNGDMRYVWIFGSIALFILLLASINFINLSTARSANRAMEVGVRKVLGSIRHQLIGQFLMESVLLSLLAFAVGIVLTEFFLPYFNDVAGSSLSIPWLEGWFLPLMLAAAILIGCLSGIYPAFYLSSFRPIEVLKGKLRHGAKSGPFRGGLVVFQFTASIVMLISTMVVYRQMNFIQTANLGFDKNQVILIQDTYTLGQQIGPFKQALLQLPNVEKASVSNYLPVEGFRKNQATFWPTGKNSPKDKVSGIQSWQVDHDYIETMRMQMAAGRNFSINIPSDSQAVIINERMAQLMGFNDPVGKQITTFGDLTFPVIGVVEDFHYESLKDDVGGLCLFIGNSPASVSVRTTSGDIASVIGQLKETWQSFNPTQPFRYAFLDEQFAEMYKTEHRTGKIFSAFAILAIVIACLGLFALAAFTTEQRLKEISIRRILGATSRQIFLLLTRHFVLLVLIALFIAAPLGYILMRAWLADFTYRIHLGIDLFVIAGFMALAITMATISYHAIRVVMINPAETLRDE